MQINLPNFTAIDPEQIEQQLDALLQQNREAVTQLLQQQDFTWENLITPLENLDDCLNQFWSPVSHLNSVMNSSELRIAYNACIPKLSDYATEIGQNHDLFLAYQHIKQTQYANLDVAQQKVIDNALRDFKLSGVALTGVAKKQYQTLQLQLSNLTTKFEENVLDATNRWTYHTEDQAELAGLPDYALASAKQQAEQHQLNGWVLTLQIPCYLAVMTYADNRDLRERMYHAYLTRASELSTHPEYDNTEVMYNILSTRLALAKLLGYQTYAELSLATKMAQQPQEVFEFLTELNSKVKPQSEQEFAELTKFARNKLNIDELDNWDIAYTSEKLKQQRFHFSQNQVRDYFPQQHVLNALFHFIQLLYGMQVTAVTDADKWHDDVQVYQITDEQQQTRGYLYMDLYARTHKRNGAWMDDCVVRRKLANGTIQLPVAFLTCNFNKPAANQPALLTHDDVITLFHEMGHSLHHLLTEMNYSDISGINGVPWDAVELPSQFFENWCWHPESLQQLAQHYKTGAALPDELLQQMLNAKNFQSAMMLARQLEFALFDFTLHQEFNPEQKNQIATIFHEIHNQVAVVPAVDYNRFAHSFSHIFAGGYAAGYYSYLWAEVLASDAFGAFLETGIFNKSTGRKFLSSVLANGGSREPLALFTEFRGRAPNNSTLLTQRGIG
jgi:oligopeptidase A